MKVLVCGSRTFKDYRLLRQVLGGLAITGIIEGGARGADRLARQYAEESGIPVQTFPAKWDEHGKSAGPIRNAQMLAEGLPDEVIAFLGPVAIQEFQYGLSDSKYSRGTKNMIDQAIKAGVPVTVIDVG